MSRSLRAVAVLSFVLTCLLSLSNTSQARGGVYPPKAEACERYSGTLWDVPADEVVDAYTGCFIDESVDATGSILCPDGTYADGNYCYPIADEDLNDGWYDDQGNLIPHLGECPDGYFIWESPANGLDHAICSLEPEDVSGPVETPVETPVDDPAPSDKEIVPVVGPAYVVGTNGEGLVCRDAPNGTAVTTLPEGTWVNRLEVYAAPGEWQRIAYQDGDISPDCYVAAEYLSDTPATAAMVTTVEEGTDVNVIESPANGPVAATVTTETATDNTVKVLPQTGTGTAYQPPINGEPQPTLTTEQRQWAIAIAVLCGIGLVVGLIMTRPSEPPLDRW